MTMAASHAADKKLQDVTVKRLTYGNPTMKSKFDEAQKNRENPINETDNEK